jgi:hypothetical protein
MTEAEWLHCTDPGAMLALLRGQGKPRKLRLFACACCRRIWHLLKDERSRAAVAASEDFADKAIGREELRASCQQAMLGKRQFDYYVHPEQNAAASVARASVSVTWIMWLTEAALGNEAVRKRGGTTAEVNLPLREQVGEAERKACVALLRDLLSNPFRPLRVDPTWLTWNGGTVPKLARAVYEQRCLPEGTLDGARLGVLADALEEAGCSEEEVLGHCRAPGPHYHGCWLVDRLLGWEWKCAVTSA